MGSKEILARRIIRGIMTHSRLFASDHEILDHDLGVANVDVRSTAWRQAFQGQRASLDNGERQETFYLKRLSVD